VGSRQRRHEGERIPRPLPLWGRSRRTAGSLKQGASSSLVKQPLILPRREGRPSTPALVTWPAHTSHKAARPQRDGQEGGTRPSDPAPQSVAPTRLPATGPSGRPALRVRGSPRPHAGGTAAPDRRLKSEDARRAVHGLTTAPPVMRTAAIRTRAGLVLSMATGTLASATSPRHRTPCRGEDSHAIPRASLQPLRTDGCVDGTLIRSRSAPARVRLSASRDCRNLSQPEASTEFRGTTVARGIHEGPVQLTFSLTVLISARPCSSCAVSGVCCNSVSCTLLLDWVLHTIQSVRGALGW